MYIYQDGLPVAVASLILRSRNFIFVAVLGKERYKNHWRWHPPHKHFSLTQALRKLYIRPDSLVIVREWRKRPAAVM